MAAMISVKADSARIWFIAVLAAAISTSAAAQTSEVAPAQSTSQSDAADIIVTARLASESLIDVPLQVSVRTGAMLERTNANNLPKIAETLPFVTIGKQTGGSGGAFIIRGIGTFSGDNGVKQTVLLNLDNVFIGRAKVINQAFYDIGQVEVLKGPQALFYGKNSPAGVISISTKDPGQELEGYARAGYEFVADERFIEGAVSVPLTNTLSVRVAGRASGMEGYLKNLATGYAVNPFSVQFPYLAAFPSPGPAYDRSPHTRELAARATILWKPVDEFSAKLKYSYGLSHANGDNNFIELGCRRGVTVITTFGLIDSQNDCKLNRKIANGGFPVGLTVNQQNANGGLPFSDTKTHVVSLNLDYDSEKLSVAAITGYFKLTYDGAQAAGSDSQPTVWGPQAEDSDSFSQEIRVSTKLDFPVNFVAGAYYGKTNQKNQTFAMLAFLGQGYDPVAQTYITYHRLIEQSTTTLSAFGQAKWSILENLELDGGVRYTSEKVTDFNGNLYRHPKATAYRAAGDFFDREKTFHNWSPEATLTWHPEAGQTVYASYKTGYKSGGFSTPSPLLSTYTDASTRFAPEKVRGFEVGYKAQLFDRKLTIDLTAYRYNYKSQQVTAFVPDSFAFLVTNAAASRVQGIEAQATLRPTQGLNLNAALGYNDARYVDFPGATCYAGQNLSTGCRPFNGANSQDLSGRTLPRAPHWSGNAGFTYDHAISGAFKLTWSGSAIYTSGYLPQDNLDPFFRQSAFWKFNAAVTLATSDDKFEIALIGRNLSNTYEKVLSNDKSGGSVGNYSVVLGRPREVAVQGTVRF